ncbi:MAG: ATP-binding protein [Thermomicrobiales bacterium]
MSDEWDAESRRGLVRGYIHRVRTSLRSKLTVSHLLVQTFSLLIYAAGGFFLLLAILISGGYSFRDLLRESPVFIALTIFVLFNIFVITLCGFLSATIVSRYMARRLTRQIDELVRATDEFAQGNMRRRAEVMSSDEMGGLAERFNLFAARLEDLDAQRRSFVANISHDLRTPIAIIRGHLDAQMRPALDDGIDVAAIDPKETFRAIDHELATLASLIDDLFTLSRLEEAVLPIELVSVDLVTLIENAVRGIRPYALQQARVSVNALVPLDLPPVLGDETRITQVINNLVHNAIRHTPAGGLVIVAAESLPNAHAVEVAVRDTGVGIAPEDLPRIFDRFYHGDSTRSPGGTGLGLSIVKQLVEGQNGSVAVESQVGEGTSISFRLPMTKAA